MMKNISFLPTNQKKSLITALISVILSVLIALLVNNTLAHVLSVCSNAEAVSTITNVTYKTAEEQTRPIELPASLTGLTPRTAVTLYAKLSANQQDCLLIKTVYTQLRVYADDTLIYSSGQDGSYPAFLLDPPTIQAIVPLPDDVQNLRFEYRSPAQRSTMALPVVRVGSALPLFLSLLQDNLFSLLFSVFLILAGLTMVITALLLLRSVPHALSFIWLGLFSIATGGWVFGECNLTAFLLPYPSALYILAFIGLFTMIIPFLKYGIIIINPYHKLPIRIMVLTLCVAATGAFILQLTGLVSLSRSMYVFHILDPLALLVFVVFLLIDAIRYKNKMARQFLLPFSVLALSATLEVFNYSVRITNLMSFFFQMGVLVFLLWLSVLGIRFVRNSIRAGEDKKRLEFEVAAKNKQIALQQAQYNLLMDNIETSKRARHDLRHQLTALKDYADRQDASGMQTYLSELIGAVPTNIEAALCSNYAVNAVVNYYKLKAEQMNIRTKTELYVPESSGSVLDTDLCILFGNLLENAIEACQHLESGQFIGIKAGVHKGYFFILIDNSFDGNCRNKNGVLYSRKRNYKYEGVGLSSVKTIAEKYDGFVKYKINGDVFEASVFVNMKAEQETLSVCKNPWAHRREHIQAE